MSVGVKRRVTHAPVLRPVRNWIKRRKQEREGIEWEANGRPLPPPHIVKQRAIREHAERHGTTILVETGRPIAEPFTGRIVDEVAAIARARRERSRRR